MYQLAIATYKPSQNWWLKTVVFIIVHEHSYMSYKDWVV